MQSIAASDGLTERSYKYILNEMPIVSTKVIDPVLLNAALEGLELQKKRIDEQIARVQSLLPTGRAWQSAAVTAVAHPINEAPMKTRRKRTLSASARKRIADAQKKRWAAFRKKTS